MGLYVIPTDNEVAFAAAGTTKYMLGVKAGTDFGLLLCGFTFDIDGLSADGDPLELAIRHCTFATNPPGTASTGVTEVVVNGRRAANGITGAENWTTVPTVVGGVVWRGRADSNKLILDKDIPLLDQPDTALAEGFVVSALCETGDTLPTATFKGELRVRRC